MSGILALLRTDGVPVEPQLARRLTDSMALRGPDAQETWCGGRVALGHSLLRTTYESAGEHQPLSLDGHVWIVADGRVDARRDLVRTLGGETEGVLLKAPDAELILRAYRRWGDACVEYLLGDFAFAIWDGPRQRLFCARDHMGVKPFYYASVGRWLLVGSTIESLRRHPDVSDRLNDLAIADFLLFGYNQEHGTTSFRDIQRLPPAHTLTWSDSGLAIHPYWTLPIEEPVYYRRDSDYIDEFKALVRQAVDERLRTERVSIFMSGGLDSSGLAVVASQLLTGASKPVQAFTFAFDSLIAYSEREYAGAVASHLGVPIRFYALDQEQGWRPESAAGTPEPTAMLTDIDPELRCYRDMAANSRTAFYGEGPDNALMYEWKPHLKYLIRQRRFGRLAADISKHVVVHRRVPLLPTLPRMVLERRQKKDADSAFPTWLAPDLVTRLGLEARWRHVNTAALSPHPVRPRAYASLLTVQWQSLFETLEPDYTGVPIEVRHPYVDVRLLGFLLKVPSLPWCRVKHLQRQALRGDMPEAVRRRPKTPLADHPDRKRIERLGLPVIARGDALSAFGEIGRLPDTMANADAKLRFVALSHWLAKDDKIKFQRTVEQRYG